ncbi:MAG: OmpA family protein, partial [Proteobacteria bacterium]|nr:OmpA family protein [Pseudomonadota bacterium]
MRLIPVALLLAFSTACATTSGGSSRSEDLAPLQPVLFTSGAGALATPSDYMRVGQAAQRLQQDDEAVLLVAGYSDASGDANTNQAISQQRADLVRQLLVEAGVPSDKIIAVGLGELPDTGDASADRRVEFIFASSSDGVADQDELLDVLSEA